MSGKPYGHGHRLPRYVVAAWRSGSFVGLDQRSYSTLSPVSTGMGDRVSGLVRLPEAALYFGM